MANKKKINIMEIDPDKRVWEYDDDGTKIYKPDQGYQQRLSTPKNIIGVLTGGKVEAFKE